MPFWIIRDTILKLIFDCIIVTGKCMLRWKRCIILTFISGAAFAAPEINVKQNESLPDLGSQQHNRMNKPTRVNRWKSAEPITSSTPPRKGLKTWPLRRWNLRPEAICKVKSPQPHNLILKTHSLPTVRSVRTSPLVRVAIWMAVPSIILFLVR